MKAIYFWVSDDLHQAWRATLGAKGLTGKTILNAFVESYVRTEEGNGKKGKRQGTKNSK
ncbi:hypothetical protein ES702_07704 [subsurface metagenome]